MPSKYRIEPGKTYEAEFPFVRIVSNDVDVDFTYKRWKPGFQRELEHPDGGSTTTMATGMGKVILSVVHLCTLPGRYHQRVFYKKKWKAPDGSELGGGRLEVSTRGKFDRLLDGITVDDYDEDYRVTEQEDYLK